MIAIRSICIDEEGNKNCLNLSYLGFFSLTFQKGKNKRQNVKYIFQKGIQTFQKWKMGLKEGEHLYFT